MLRVVYLCGASLCACYKIGILRIGIVSCTRLENGIHVTITPVWDVAAVCWTSGVPIDWRPEWQTAIGDETGTSSVTKQNWLTRLSSITSPLQNKTLSYLLGGEKRTIRPRDWKTVRAIDPSTLFSRRTRNVGFCVNDLKQEKYWRQEEISSEATLGFWKTLWGSFQLQGEPAPPKYGPPGFWFGPQLPTPGEWTPATLPSHAPGPIRGDFQKCEIANFGPLRYLVFSLKKIIGEPVHGFWR